MWRTPCRWTIFSIGPVPGGDRRGWAGAVRVLHVLVVLGLGALLLVPFGAAALAQTCPEPFTVDLITGASASDVIGVVEYEVIAESTSGFGASVGATRRIWGGVVAERWMVVPSGPECLETPVAGLGERWYLIVGPTGEPVFGVPSAGELSELEAGALASIVGEPVSIQVGSLDRLMAWMRVHWWVLAAVLVPAVAVIAVIRARRAGARRDYLF